MTDMTDETKGDGMTIEKVREYADAVSLCSSPENVSRFNQAAGRWVYINLDAIEASLSRQVSVSDEDVAKAWLIFDGQFYADRRGIESMRRMRAVLEADRAGRGVVPDKMDFPTDVHRLTESTYTRSNGKIRWHKPIVHAHDCNLNMADVAQRMKGCDCGALSTHDKTKA